jgi:ubiquinone/menaquinone biosynthesis C-methylase UbiE
MNQEGFLNPQQILSNLPLKEDMVACDFGCGSGGWVLPLSKILKTGVIYAIDVLDEAISVLNSKISTYQAFNIKPMVGDVEKGVKLKEDYADLILMTNLLFQIDNRAVVTSEAKRILKTKGMLLVIDWNKDAVIGDREGRISKEEARELLERQGFKTEKEFSAGNFHWGLLLRKI